MIIKLEDIADISLGTILTRVNAGEHDDAVSVDTISMQEVSYFAGKSGIKGETLFSKVKSNKLNSCEFTQNGDVIFGLTSRCAMVIDCCRENKLLASNFFRIRIHDTNILSPLYLCWLLNENSYVQNYFNSNKQGNATVSVLRAQDLKGLMIEVIPYEEQIKISNYYFAYLEKFKVDSKLSELNFKLNKELINKYYKGVVKNEN